VNIGRSPDSTYCIMSPVISRCHATVQKQKDNSWAITDNNSVNGVAINGKRLQPSTSHVLENGDVVTFGVPKTPGAAGEFVYKFFASLKIRKESQNKRKQQRTSDSDAKRLKIENVDMSCHATSASTNASHETEENKVQDASMIKQYEEKLRALAAELEEKEAEKLAVQQQLQREREERHAIELVHKEQEERVNELDAKQRQLEEEKALVELQMQKELEMKLQEREDVLRTQMNQQLTDLAAEKKQIEERLQLEMEKAVQEKDKELHDRLQGEKERLQKVIEMKGLEQKALESQLAESRMENEKARADTLSARDTILQNFAETMETELQCSICSELFIQATSLNCAHAFCALCIRQWLAVKKECPVCRAAVTSQVRSYVLDNYIDCMVEQLSTDLKKRRADLVAERKESQAKLDEAEKKQVAGPSGTGSAAAQGRRRGGRARGTARGRGRSQAGRGGIVTATAAPPLTTSTVTTATVGPAASITVTHDSVDASDPVGAEPILVSDVESETSTNSNEDDEFSSDVDRYDSFDRYHSFTDTEEDSDGDYVRGNGGAYYGGYGRCFKCGSRGHWANGCPF
ncbi:hypothetical protein BaRGS_00004441, partial [Batillaria attramentaria]